MSTIYHVTHQRHIPPSEWPELQAQPEPQRYAILHKRGIVQACIPIPADSHDLWPWWEDGCETEWRHYTVEIGADIGVSAPKQLELVEEEQ